MSQHNHADREIRVLRQLVDELRAEPAPELDWARVERNLLARIRVERPVRPGLGAGSWPSLMVLAAAAAAIVLLATSQQRPAPTAASTTAAAMVNLAELPPAGGKPGAPPGYQASALPLGATVASDTQPVRFSLPGVVDWTLAPHSQLRVAGMSLPHVLVLERGSVHAEVVPRHDSNSLVETFAVEAGGTRVAVHGTVLSVSLAGDRVTVQVDRGTVSVGPTGLHGATTGRLLLGPARAVFAASSGQLVEVLEAEPPAIAMGEPGGSTPAGRGAHDGVGADGDAADRNRVGEYDDSPDHDAARAAPNGPWAHGGGRPVAADDGPDDAAMLPTPAASTAPPAGASEQDRLTVAAAQALMLSCLTAGANAAGGGDVQVTVSTNISVRLDDVGKVRSVRFDPPLRPDLQKRCAAALFGNALAVEGRSASFTVQFATR